MSKLKFYPVNDKAEPREYISVDEKYKSSRGCFFIVTYVDKETRQHVAYVPSLEISGYGETKEKAQELLQISIEKFFDFLFSDATTAYDELSKLGWKRSWYKKKEFSKAYVDVSGDLKDFAVADTIEVEQIAI